MHCAICGSGPPLIGGRGAFTLPPFPPVPMLPDQPLYRARLRDPSNVVLLPSPSSCDVLCMWVARSGEVLETQRALYERIPDPDYPGRTRTRQEAEPKTPPADGYWAQPWCHATCASLAWQLGVYFRPHEGKVFVPHMALTGRKGAVMVRGLLVRLAPELEQRIRAMAGIQTGRISPSWQPVYNRYRVLANWVNFTDPLVGEMARLVVAGEEADAGLRKELRRVLGMKCCQRPSLRAVLARMDHEARTMKAEVPEAPPGL